MSRSKPKPKPVPAVKSHRLECLLDGVEVLLRCEPLTVVEVACAIDAVELARAELAALATIAKEVVHLACAAHDRALEDDGQADVLARLMWNRSSDLEWRLTTRELTDEEAADARGKAERAQVQP